MPSPRLLHVPRLPGAEVLRVVTLASRTGRYGGPFDTATRQTRALLTADRSARLLAGVFPGDRPERAVLAAGRYVRVRSLPGVPGFVSTFSFRMAVAVVQEVHHARVVHLSFARELIPLWCAVVAVGLGRRLVLQPHGMLTSRTSVWHRLLDLVCVRPLFRRASSVIALSDVEVEDLTAWNAGAMPPVHVLGNPLPPGVRPPDGPRTLPAPEAVALMFIARLHPRKRVVDFVESAAAARTAGRPWQWTVVGPDHGDGRIAVHGAEENPLLEYAGAVSAEEVVDRLETATVFVMPSEREPWGNVLATAIALGIPCVVARSAALAAQVEAYGAGRVVPDGDPGALLAAVEDLLEDERYTAASSGALHLRRDLLDADALRAGLLDALSGSPAGPTAVPLRP